MKTTKSPKTRRGFVLLTTAVSAIALFGAVGLAVDVGHAFIAKNETQVYADAAAIAATMQLDGTSAGIQRAQQAATADQNLWNFSTSAFSSVQVEFGQSTQGPWESNPPDPKGFDYARVLASAPLPLYFLPVVSTQSAGIGAAGLLLLGSPTLNVSADSAAGQMVRTYFDDGLFPFSPFAQGATGPDYGLTEGTNYTIRWAANPQLNKNVCPGDNIQAMIDLANASGGSERGYYQETGASVIRDAIEYDSQVFQVEVGQSINMTGGAKQTELDALLTRIAQDSDSSSQTYEDYVAAGKGNGRRLVGMPINTGDPNYTVEQIGAFFLLPASSYSNGGNSAWCAEYVGAWVKGAKTKGASESGAYAVELVQ